MFDQQLAAYRARNKKPPEQPKKLKGSIRWVMLLGLTVVLLVPAAFVVTELRKDPPPSIRIEPRFERLKVGEMISLKVEGKQLISLVWEIDDTIVKGDFEIEYRYPYERRAEKDTIHVYSNGKELLHDSLIVDLVDGSLEDKLNQYGAEGLSRGERRLLKRQIEAEFVGISAVVYVVSRDGHEGRKYPLRKYLDRMKFLRRYEIHSVGEERAASGKISELRVEEVKRDE